jgi:bifunctional DNase/RNase
MSTDERVEMTVESVRVHMLSSQHVVILKAADRDRYLPIWIGPWEANAIAMRLQGMSPERPLTHDLLASMLESLQVHVDRVVVSDLAEETFHARIFMEADGRRLEIDSRPSDAIALAVRASTPIFATEAVLDRAGVTPSADDDERLTVFRDFVNSLEIEDEPPSEPPSGTGGERRLLD